MNGEKTGLLWQKEHMSFVTHIFRNDQHWSWWRPLNIRSDDFNLTIKNPGLEALLLAALLYQGNHDRNHNLWNIASTERYILHFQVLLECCYIQRESSQWENWNNLLCRKDSSLTDPYCQCRGVGRGEEPWLHILDFKKSESKSGSHHSLIS